MAAARQLPRRILSLLVSTQPRVLSHRETLRRIVPVANSIFHGDGFWKRGFQTVAEAGKQSVGASDVSMGHKVTSKLKQSSTHDMAMVFTCNVCETRSVKTLSKVSYEKGVVLARCGGCDNVHLIADRLGWFGETGSVEEFLAERGEEVKKGSAADTLSLTFDDLAGKDRLDLCNSFSKS